MLAPLPVDHFQTRCHNLFPEADIATETDRLLGELLGGGRRHDNHISVPVRPPYAADPANGRVSYSAVVTHALLQCNDASISLGQAAEWAAQQGTEKM